MRIGSAERSRTEGDAGTYLEHGFTLCRLILTGRVNISYLAARSRFQLNLRLNVLETYPVKLPPRPERNWLKS